MTALAGDYRMEPNQRKSSQIVVEFGSTAPTCLDVARVTADPKLTLMAVFGVVARDARHGRLHARVSMTTFALGGRVLAAQGESGGSVMVESHLRPFRRRMTTFAPVTAAAFMPVLKGMTG